MMTIRIAAIPVQDRPRERLQALGSGALSDQELLAILLRSGTRGVGATELAARLVAEFGGLRSLAAAKVEELASAAAGVGVAKATSIVAAFELGRRLDRPEDYVNVRSAEDVARIARPYLEGQRREKVLVLICDAANRLKRMVVVSEGSIDRSLVPVREILNAVLRHDGRAFALAHNHPSGNCEPSGADSRATQTVGEAAKAVGLRFLTHVVLTDQHWTEVAVRTPPQTRG